MVSARICVVAMLALSMAARAAAAPVCHVSGFALPCKDVLPAMNKLWTDSGVNAMNGPPFMAGHKEVGRVRCCAVLQVTANKEDMEKFLAFEAKTRAATPKSPLNAAMGPCRALRGVKLCPKSVLSTLDKAGKTMKGANTTMMATDTMMATNTTMMAIDAMMATNTTMMATDTSMATNTTMMATDTSMATNTTMPADTSMATNTTMP